MIFTLDNSCFTAESSFSVGILFSDQLSETTYTVQNVALGNFMIIISLFD